MKIAISSNGKTLEDLVSDVFGRCPFFIIAEIKGKKIELIEILDNISLNQSASTGVTVAQTVLEKEVTAIIAGNIGPRALDVFKQFKIETFQAKGTVKQALQDYLENKLKKYNKGAINYDCNSDKWEKRNKRDSCRAFGRCQTYTFLDTKGNLVKVIDNTSEHMGGIGLPPELMKKNGATILICRSLGPNALDLCKKLNIEVYVNQADTVKEMFETWNAKKIKKATLEDICEEHKH